VPLQPRRIFLLTIILIAIIPKFYNLASDPPFDFPLGFIADEGWWSHNARNYALFGRSIIDEFNQGYIISYPFFLTQKIVFSLLGVGFYQARVVSSIAGLLVILIFFSYLKREKDLDTAILATFFLASNYVFTAYCRVALVDVMQLMFLLLSLYLINLKKPRYYGYLFSGFCFGLALITKTTVFFAIFTFGLIFFYDYFHDPENRKKVIARFLLLMTGMSSLLACWYLLCVKPRGDEIAVLYSRLAYDNFHGNFITAFKNIFALFASISSDGISISHFVTQMPVVQLLSWLFALYLLLDYMSKKGISPLKRIDRLDLVFLSLIILGFITLAPMTHKPLRRYILFIPSLCYFAARFSDDIKGLNLKGIFEFLKPKGLLSPARILITSLISIPPLIILSPLLARLLKTSSTYLASEKFDILFRKSHISNYQVISVVGIYILCHSIIYLISKKEVIPGIRISFSLQGVIVLFLIVNSYIYWTHLSKPTFTMRDTSKKLGEVFTEKTLVIGGVADSLCLENKAKTAHIWESPQGRILNEAIIKNGEADYLLSLKRAGDIIIPEGELSSRLKLERIELLKLCPTRDGKKFRIEVEFSKIIK